MSSEPQYAPQTQPVKKASTIVHIQKTPRKFFQVFLLTMDYARNAQGLTCNQALLTSALVGGVVAYKPQLQALLPLPPIVHFVAAGALTQMVCRLTGTPTMRTPMNEIVYGGAAAVVGGMIVGKYSSKAVSPVFQM